MEILQHDYKLDIPTGAFPLSTDSTLLGDFVRLPKNATVCDLGAGCGTLGLFLCAKDPSCSVTGVEIDPLAHEGALQNIARNNLAHRMKSILGDLRCPIGDSFHICVSNPPYYTGGPSSQACATARRDDLCSTEDLMQAASRCLRYGGDFYLVHKPEKLASLCALGGKYHLEAKHLRLIRHREGGPITLILLQLKKGGKPGLTIDEKSLFLANNTPTTYYQSVYHLQEV
jgi:tRNA1Val (adenine37-N6)-methyltransferase